MTSPTEKQPGDKLDSIKLLEQAAATLHSEALQLRRTLWLLVQQMGGRVALNESKIDLLWQLRFARMATGELEIVSSRQEPAKPEDISELATALVGTKAGISDVSLNHERLKHYPVSYLEMELYPHIRFDAARECWVRRSE